jgi:hypothetical protein
MNTKTDYSSDVLYNSQSPTCLNGGDRDASRQFDIYDTYRFIQDPKIQDVIDKAKTALKGWTE